ncbi:unnamed protein product [Ilex paraguariensis]|uniref:Peptidase A1 domain-containing protein n=1 Tax=Ilex paraguariensis TaxID=185542 RepID=A0ABC8R0G5_9AQUA
MRRIKKQSKSTAIEDRFGSSVIFPVTGNVYPKGYYQVTLNIGHPSKSYFLDMDTGSDLTWLECDAPCTKCTPVIVNSSFFFHTCKITLKLLPIVHNLFVFVCAGPSHSLQAKQNVVTCKDTLYGSLHWPGNHPCETPDEQCDYEVQYADHGSSMGVLVKDSFPLRFINGSIVGPRLTFRLVA